MVLSEHLIRKYAKLIDEGVLPRETENPGSTKTIYYTGSHVIKVPHEDNLEGRQLITNEDTIAKILKEEGINVPETHGVHDTYETPFLVMERLHILNPTSRELTRAQKIESARQYARQIVHVEDIGIIPGDVNAKTNYGFDPRQNKGFFFDLSDWRLAA